MKREQNNKEQNNKNVTSRKKRLLLDGSKIELSVPWITDDIINNFISGNIHSPFSNEATIFKREIPNKFLKQDETKNDFFNNFIKERTRLHETYIKEQAKNKRLGIILAFLLILAAATIVLFAPHGREKISYWIGAALIIFAAGASGFGRIWGKVKNISFGATQNNNTFKDSK